MSEHTRRDYAAWHQEYDRPGSPLHLRLLVVRDLIAEFLDEAGPGPVRVVSMCAGDGRDLLVAAARHRRGEDVQARLVELDPRNASAARRTVARLGLDPVRISVVEGDAGHADAYAGAVPADLVLVCGVLGNISDDDVFGLIRFLPRLCAPGAGVVWTRYPEPPGIIERIEGALRDSGFEPTALVVNDTLGFGVGAARLVGEPLPYERGRRLFVFVR